MFEKVHTTDFRNHLENILVLLVIEINSSLVPFSSQHFIIKFGLYWHQSKWGRSCTCMFGSRDSQNRAGPWFPHLCQPLVESNWLLRGSCHPQRNALHTPLNTSCDWGQSCMITEHKTEMLIPLVSELIPFRDLHKSCPVLGFLTSGGTAWVSTLLANKAKWASKAAWDKQIWKRFGQGRSVSLQTLMSFSSSFLKLGMESEQVVADRTAVCPAQLCLHPVDLFHFVPPQFKSLQWSFSFVCLGGNLQSLAGIQSYLKTGPNDSRRLMSPSSQCQFFIEVLTMCTSNWPAS
jgi:hypothetical protein